MSRESGVLLERDLEPVVDALDQARAGRGQTLIVDGPAGSGVSAVLDAAAELARARDMAVVDVRIEALLTTHVPTLVLVDDAHWVAADALQALIELRPALERLPYCVALGHHPGPGRFDALAAHLLDDLGAVRVTTTPLSPDAVQRLAVVVLDDDELSERFVSELHALTAGNPWMIRAVLGALRDRDLPPIVRSLSAVAAAPPDPVAQRVRRLLGDRAPAVTALAEAVAVFGEPLTLARAARVAELPVEDAAVAADALVAAGLTEAGEPLVWAQPLVGATVRATLPPFGAAAVHARALALLDEDGAPPERRGGHLLHQPLSGDPATTDALRSAAAQASPDEAVALLRHALAAPPAPALEPLVLAELALAEAAAGAPEAADRLDAAVAVMPDRALRGRLQVALARALLAVGAYQAAATAAETVLESLELGDPHAEPLLMVELIALAADRTVLAPGTARAQPVMMAALQGDLPEDPGLCAWLAAALAGLGGPLSLVQALLARALHDSPLVDDSHQIIGSYAQAAMRTIQDFEVAERVATAAMARAREADLPIAFLLAQHDRAIARWKLGRIDDALEDARASQARPDGPWSNHAPYVTWLLVGLHVDRGEHAEARAVLDDGRERYHGPLELANVEHAAGMLALAEGDAATALAHWLAAGEAIESFHPGLAPACLEWQSAAARAAAQLGEVALARDLAERELQRAEAVGLPGSIGIALHSAGLAAQGDERVELLRRAVADLERSPLRKQHAEALTDLGVATRDAGDPVGARAPLSAALDLADRCGATVLVARARQELYTAGARPRRAALTGVAALTASERRIAERAARGETNTEIARELFVSVKTVEGTLARAYRKLGISSRGELAEAMADAD